MKTVFKHIAYAFVLAAALVSCKSNVSDLDLKGDCQVEELTLDTFDAIINAKTRDITVRVPEDFSGSSAMTVEKLVLSEGATANIRQGQVINMDAGQAIHVENGDLYLDWNLSVMRDEARIYSFVINNTYSGLINQEAKTITVFVPNSVNVKALTPSITYSEYAKVTPASGVTQDFTDPVVYTVDNNTAHSEYVATVVVIDKPSAVFVGAAAEKDELDPEALAACNWMISNIPNSMYMSFADVKSEQINLSECKVMWWHFHKDGGVDGHDAFVKNAPEALDAATQIRTYYENGGSLLLTRYAGNLASFIGATGTDEWTTPNNCWGGDENSCELCGGPWTFRKYAEHPIWEGLISGDNPDEIYCTDAGYYITNSTSQYHIWQENPDTHWGDYKTHQDWVDRTHGKILGVGGDGAIVAWEYPADGNRGGIICIGSGCYDWYSYTFGGGYVENFHKNISIMTLNAFNYLSK